MTHMGYGGGRTAARELLLWTLLALVVATLAGSAAAGFLHLLAWATATRLAQPWLLWGLPWAGALMAWVYLRWGQRVDAGNNLLLEEIHQPREPVPLRMAPMILLTTVLSHLFGASVGREGTAVQMGGALADGLSRPLRLDARHRPILLKMGMAAGFAAVFGTPLAGAVFALEVLALGRMRYAALYPCVLAALLSDQVCLAWGAQHSHYRVDQVPAWTPQVLLGVMAAAVLFGLTARVFSVLTTALSGGLRTRLPDARWRAAVGGAVVVLASVLIGTDRYLGLGLPVIEQAFGQGVQAWDAGVKLLFTTWSLASGFKGGEVTPLFFIGSTLGHSLAAVLPLPPAFLAGLGLAAVFAAATNTPLASTLLAIELFGAAIAPHAALACVLAYLSSGHSGIYRAQRVGHPKRSGVPEGVTLGQWRDRGGCTQECDNHFP